jgi:hypothetical protein
MSCDIDLEEHVFAHLQGVVSLDEANGAANVAFAKHRKADCRDSRNSLVNTGKRTIDSASKLMKP